MKQEERNIKYDERIDRYLRGLMGDDERANFEQDVDNDQELRERLVATAMLAEGIAQEGMEREGQYQLDTIKEMSPEEFEQAISDETGRKPGFVVKWAAAIATVAIGAGGLLYPILLRPPVPMIAENKNKIEAPAKPNVVKTPAKPTLASLAKEYNRPIAGEPDEFVAIRQHIQQGDSEDLMAVIDKVEAPQYIEGAKGAEDADVIKEAQQLYADCTHWYKALVYLKNSDKDSAITELKAVKEHGTNEELVNRASALLKKLGQ